MTKREISTRAARYRTLQQREAELKKQMDAIKQELRGEMAERGVDQLDAGLLTVADKLVESSRLDTTALKRECPELAQRYTVTSEARRFTIA